MLTKNQNNLISALAEADIDEELTCAIVMGMEDEQMPILTEYIRDELKEEGKVTDEKVVDAMLFIKGELEIEDD